MLNFPILDASGNYIQANNDGSYGVQSQTVPTGLNSSPGYSGSSTQSQSVPIIKSNFWNDPLNYDFGPSLDKLLGNVPVIGQLNPALESINILTDIPRLITVVIGLILLIAGLFLLGAKPAVQIVGSVKKTAGAIGEIVA